MLDGRITISIRRSAVGHWDPNAAAKEGKALAQNNPLLFDTLFAPVKSGFKKLLGTGIPILAQGHADRRNRGHLLPGRPRHAESLPQPL